MVEKPLAVSLEHAERMAALARTQRVDDDATIILTYPHMQAIIQGSWNWPVTRKDIEIYGASGYLIAVNNQTIRLRTHDDTAEQMIDLPPAPDVVRDPFAYLAAVVRGDEHVEPGNLWSLENGVSVVKILDAARRSAREGRSVQPQSNCPLCGAPSHAVHSRSTRILRNAGSVCGRAILVDI